MAVYVYPTWQKSIIHVKPKMMPLLSSGGNLTSTIPSDMAAVLQPVINDPIMQLNLVCKVSINNQHASESEFSVIKVPISESKVESKLDIDELHEFYAMCTRPLVRAFITQLITCLGTVSKDFTDYTKTNQGKKRKWSDIVADRHSDISDTVVTDPQPIRTVLTSRSSQHYDGTLNLEMKNPTNQSTGIRRNKRRQPNKPTITVWGDSHARGIASELLHQLNHSCNITGYVKPNAGLSDVLKTGNLKLGGLGKRDTIIVVGGSNDLDRNVHKRNLTSLVSFLEETQNTNVILTDVPMRNDREIGAPINKLITNYNKKLHKVTKLFSYVNSIKVTTNRNHFTTHGLHLNRVGKESLVKELIKHLPNRLWKDDLKDADVQLLQSEVAKGATVIAKNIDTDVKDVKQMCNIDSKQHTVDQTTVEVSSNALPSSSNHQVDKLALNCTQTQIRNDTDGYVKTHRNCPKIRNNDFLWN